MSTQPVIGSAAVSETASQEQIDKRYEEYRRRTGRSRFEVSGKEGIHYLWAPRDDSSEMTRLEMEGFELTREPKAEEVLSGKARPQIKAGGLRQDGTYVIGDVILVQCSEENYQFHLRDVTERMEAAKKAAKDNFLIEAEKAGAPTFTFDRPGAK